MNKRAIKHIEDRIKYLRKIETEYWNKRYDMSYPFHERELYKRFEKDFEARRKELELLLTDLT